LLLGAIVLALSTPGKPRYGYGFWRYGEGDVDAAIEMLSLARDHGIDHLDTADVYGGPGGFGGSEKLLGEIRRRAPKLFDGAVIATKAGIEIGVPYNSSRAYLISACEGSLRRLNTERIDLFYIHRPDLLTHPAELAATLDELVASGKVGAVGVSNFTVMQVEALVRYLKSPLRVHQIEFSAAHIEPLFDGTLDQAMQRDIAVAAWSPLAGGRLGDLGNPDKARVQDVLRRIGARCGSTAVAAALGFLRLHPAVVTPILGTKTPARLRACLKADAVTLSRADWYDVIEACRGVAMP
jgi:predicted oxidoreductase